MGLLPALVSLPNLALPWGPSGWGGSRRSPGRDKSVPQLLQLHPRLTTLQRKMKVAVLSVVLLFTILLCTPADAQGILEASGSPLETVENNVDGVNRSELPLVEQLKELLRQKRLAVSLDG